MDPKTLSASAAEKYEDCPAGYAATIIQKVPDENNDAAILGGLCHVVLERFVAEGWYKKKKTTFDDMATILDEEYHNYFTDLSMKEEALEILRNWYGRQDWEGREVISTEEKRTFDLPTSRGILPVTYIWDRADDLSGGKRESIEVVDYKSYRVAFSEDELKHKLQPRIYALAANIMWPDVKEIWVSFDFIRFGVPTSLRFTREQNVETWNYLKDLAERIYEDDGTEERINPKCNWCVRSWTCETLDANIMGGGRFNYRDFDAAVLRLAELKSMEKVIKDQMGELRDQVFEEMERRSLGKEFDTPDVSVKLRSRKKRSIDVRRATQLLGAETIAKVAKLNISDIDELLKPGVLDDETAEALRDLIVTDRTPPWMDFTLKHGLSE